MLSSLPFDGTYGVGRRKLDKTCFGFGGISVPRNKSKALQQPRGKQEQLNLGQGFTSARAATSSKGIEISLVGDQLAFCVYVAVRIEHGRVVPTFGIKMNSFCVRIDNCTLRDTVSAESCVVDRYMRNC